MVTGPGEVFDSVEERWSGVRLDAELRARLAPTLEPMQGLSLERRAEWCLAQAALLRHPTASEHLDRWMRGLLERWFGRTNYPPPLRDEAIHAVRMLLLGVDAPGKLAEFDAQGPLDRWLQVVGVRSALNTLRGRGKLGSAAMGDDELRSLAATLDPELELLGKEHRALLKRALAEALKELDDRGRLLLSLRYVHGTPLEALATMLGAHRVSVSKWLRAAQDTLLAAMAKSLAPALPSVPSDWWISRPDLSVSRLFRLAEGDSATDREGTVS